MAGKRGDGTDTGCGMREERPKREGKRKKAGPKKGGGPAKPPPRPPDRVSAPVVGLHSFDVYSIHPSPPVFAPPLRRGLISPSGYICMHT
ncbi:unnamed protein product [Nezara viridula]|uniref:Uncharacterized protein n=1 Tax=Nezara viridula TaxID=85310 RepID=A0A9P0MHR9_NEZVI|nr:unnamed protein product [Nezara viridula]